MILAFATLTLESRPMPAPASALPFQDTREGAMEKPHGRDLRKGRVSQPGRAYLVTTVVRGRRPLFHDWRVGRLLVSELRAAADGVRAESLAWVIMPDHLHWLLVPHSENLDALVRRVKSRSARLINRSNGRAGAVWQKGYHDHALRHDEELRAAARYIIANPLRAGLVTRVGDYPLWDCVYLPL